jgi:hypothetical protein
MEVCAWFDPVLLGDEDNAQLKPYCAQLARFGAAERLSLRVLMKRAGGTDEPGTVCGFDHQQNRCPLFEPE